MGPFDEDIWWRWLLEQLIKLALWQLIKKAWRRLRGNHVGQAADSSPVERPPAQKPADGRKDE